MNTKQILKGARTMAVWTGLVLMAAVVFGESRTVWRCRDMCAKSQARSPVPAYSPTDWQRH